MLKEISTLFQPCQVEDILISSIIETWSLRLLTVEKPRSGTSISNQRLSELDITINHGISRVLVEQVTCKSGAPTLDGSKFSNSKMVNSLIQQTTKSLKYKAQRMKRDKNWLLEIERALLV